MDQADSQNSFTKRLASTPLRFLTDERLDFAGRVTLQKSYLIASSDRYSSAFLCKSLWQTGRLGAPWQYLNASVEDMRGTLVAPADRSVAATMMKRLRASGPNEYIAKLLECRTSGNGVFGLKARFDDFSSALHEVPELLNILAPISYIYVDCRDKLTQAVSVVRAQFTGAGAVELDATSASQPLRYDRELISRYLGRLERRRLDWWRWFEANRIDPFIIYYEDANTDIGNVTAAVAELLEVHNDTIDEVELPSFALSHDATTAEWTARFTREVESGINFEAEAFGGNASRPVFKFEPEVAATPQEQPESPFFRSESQKYKAQLLNIANAAEQASATSAGVQPMPRMPAQKVKPDVRSLRRYDQIIGLNRVLLHNAGVLDLMSGGGLCSFAALDAGAEFVVGVDPRPDRVAAAERTFTEHGLSAKSYRFANMEIMPALYDTSPETFDVIIGRGILQLLDVREFFAQVSYLRPRHVILDTVIAVGRGPIIRYGQQAAQSSDLDEPNNPDNIVATPSHELMILLCDCFGFECRVDQDGTDESGQINADGSRTRTYVLDRNA